MTTNFFLPQIEERYVDGMRFQQDDVTCNKSRAQLRCEFGEIYFTFGTGQMAV